MEPLSAKTLNPTHTQTQTVSSAIPAKDTVPHNLLTARKIRTGGGDLRPGELGKRFMIAKNSKILPMLTLVVFAAIVMGPPSSGPRAVAMLTAMVVMLFFFWSVALVRESERYRNDPVTFRREVLGVTFLVGTLTACALASTLC